MAFSVERAIEELAEFLSPLLDALESPEDFEDLLQRLGYSTAAADLIAILSSLSGLQANLTELVDIVAQKNESGAELSSEQYLSMAVLANDIFAEATEIPNNVTGLSLPETFFSDLLDLLLIDYLEWNSPQASQLLSFLGIIDSEYLLPGRDPEAGTAGSERYRVRWDRLSQFLNNPADLMEEVYGWGTTGFDAGSLLMNFSLLFDELNIVSLPIDLDPVLVNRYLDAGDTPLGFRLPIYQLADQNMSAEVGLMAIPVKGAQSPVNEDRGIALMPYMEGSVSASEPISEDGTVTLSFQADADLAGGVVFSLRPSGLSYDAGVLDNTAMGGSVRVELRKAPKPGENEILLFGKTGSTRLESGALVLAAGGEDGDFYVAGGVEGLRLVIDVSDDGLLSQIIPEPITIDAGDLLAGWRLGRGIYFEQGSGISVRIPLSIELFDVFRLHEVGIDIEFEPNVSVVFMVSADATIGPLFLGVEELGLRVTIVPNENGQFGKFDLEAGVQFPTGYAVELNGGPIKGGGGIFAQEHEYRGALSLQFQTFGLSAFAILSTRLPSGEDGFSFLASMFGEFEMQLGYGFKLTGLGGIIGIDRTSEVEALRTVLAGGRLDNILFPSNPIEDASIILNDMATIFPPLAGQYLFGPMAKIAWGTPTLIEGTLGLVLELGAQVRVLILGSVVTALPEKNAAIVVLNVDFIGTIEFDTGAVAFDATLANSRILTWPVSGEAAIRTGWGQSAGLVASVGGLHPQVPLPPNFPSLQRLTINFGSNNPSLTLTAYMGITLSAVMAGAHATLYAKGPKITFVGQVEVEGWVGFDALIKFNPFEFDTSLSLGLKLLIDGDTVCGIGGDLRLRGPNTYRINGKVWVTVCGVDVKVKINHTWGSKVTELPQSVNGLDLLLAAVQSIESFDPITVSSRVSGVTFKSKTGGGSGAAAMIDPSAGLQFVQKALPLGIKIDRIGNACLAGGFDTFNLTFKDSNAQTLTGDDAMGDFVRAHYFNLSDNEKLRGQAIEPHKSGLRLESGDDVIYDSQAARDFDFGYETIFLGDDEEDTRRLAFQLSRPRLRRGGW